MGSVALIKQTTPLIHCRCWSLLSPRPLLICPHLLCVLHTRWLSAAPHRFAVIMGNTYRSIIRFAEEGRELPSCQQLDFLCNVSSQFWGHSVSDKYKKKPQLKYKLIFTQVVRVQKHGQKRKSFWGCFFLSSLTNPLLTNKNKPRDCCLQHTVHI